MDPLPFLFDLFYLFRGTKSELLNRLSTWIFLEAFLGQTLSFLRLIFACLPAAIAMTLTKTKTVAMAWRWLWKQSEREMAFRQGTWSILRASLVPQALQIWQVQGGARRQGGETSDGLTLAAVQQQWQHQLSTAATLTLRRPICNN